MPGMDALMLQGGAEARAPRPAKLAPGVQLRTRIAERACDRQRSDVRLERSAELLRCSWRFSVSGTSPRISFLH